MLESGCILKKYRVSRKKTTLFFCAHGVDTLAPIGRSLQSIFVSPPFRHVQASTGVVVVLAQFFDGRQNDKKMVEMTAFEEFWLLGRELDHADDYP
jgi:hypothetical protein